MDKIKYIHIYSFYCVIYLTFLFAPKLLWKPSLSWQLPVFGFTSNLAILILFKCFHHAPFWNININITKTFFNRCYWQFKNYPFLKLVIRILFQCWCKWLHCIVHAMKSQTPKTRWLSDTIWYNENTEIWNDATSGKSYSKLPSAFGHVVNCIV